MKSSFLPVSTHQPYQCGGTGVFGCLTTSHQISGGNICRKISFLKKIKISTRWPSNFLWVYFWPQPPTP